MTRALILIAAFLSLAGTAALAAPPADKGKPESPGKSAAAPGQSAEKNSAKACKAERASMGDEAFKKQYGTNANKANAFGKCVSSKSKAKAKAEKDDAKDEDENENEANESKAEDAAAKKCKAERASMGDEAFKKQYGTNANKANAFGKCVSKLSKAKGSS
jgi:hypothetical protein